MKDTFKTIAFIAAAVFAASASAQGLLGNAGSQETGSNGILAVVEDRVITRDEVMREVAPFIPQIRQKSLSEFEFNKRVSDYIREIVQNMVDRELIVKEFRERGMSIPQSFLDSHFEDYIKQFKQDQEKDLIVGYMQNEKRQTVAEISPKKIKEYYEANKSKWYTPASAKISLITLKSGRNATLEDNRKLAKEIVAKYNAGEKFSDLARKYSKDDSSAKGGEWGWYKKGELNPLLDKQAFSIDAGKITEPVEIGDMIFILKVEEKKPDGISPIDDVREQIEWTIAEQNGRAMYQKWVEGLRKKAFVKYYK